MRTCTLVGVAVVLILAAEVGMLQGGSAKEESDRIAGLIKDLGDPKFAKREAASKELAGIGEPALAALQKAAAGSDDQEIRQRAAKVIAVIERGDVKSVPPPKDAVVLFDGKDLDAWVGRDGMTKPTWGLVPGCIMEARQADIRTRQTFADAYKLHVEFRVPPRPAATSQGHGNSGVYLHGRYEVQILDSYDGVRNAFSCGAIYGLAAPRVNTCKAPDVWQNYDIEFCPPRFKGGKEVVSLPQLGRLTVLHNGVLIHDKVEVPMEGTGDLSHGLPGDPAQPGPVMLQYHGSPVQFRNVWLLPLAKP